MDANEDYLDSLLNSVLSQDSGGADGGLGNAQQNNGSEAELKEIDDVLKKSDQNQMPDAEMLAMLERAESEMPAEGSDNDVPDVFDIFSSESVESEEEYARERAAEESMAGNAQDGGSGEAYLDALLNGTSPDDMTGASGQAEGDALPESLQSEEAMLPSEDLSAGEDLLSLDSLQSEEEVLPSEDLSAGEDLLSLDSLQSEEEVLPSEDLSAGEDLFSLDSLQTEEEAMPVEEPSGEQDFLSLDSLQSEEEVMPPEDLSAGEDLFSLDSLQTEEEAMPVEEPSGEQDFLSLDSLQTEEESQPLNSLPSEEDLLSLDSLQSDEEMSFGDDSAVDEDDEIQREIDELLGLANPYDEEASQNENIPAAENTGDDAVNKEEKKEKKKKKKPFGKKKAKESAEAATDGLQEGVSADMAAVEQGDKIGYADAAEGGMVQDEMSAPVPDAEPDGKKRKRKKEKAPKQKDGAEADKKPGFFAKLMNTLFEEADEDEEGQPQELEVSDENREIMAMMDNEKIENKKPGSKKAKKGKKGKADAKQESDAEGDEEAPVDEKKAKKEKKKKEKKEKKEQKAKAKQEKEQEEKAVPTKKLPKGKVFSIFAFCLTLLAVILILCFVIPQQQDLKTAREAYYNHDYLTVYQNMDGKDLNDSDYILYMRSRMVLNMQGKLDNYLVYMGMDKEMAALNELMLAVHYYQSNRSVAESYGALEEMKIVYDQVLSVLAQQYQLSETEAIEIFALDDLSYNERLYYLVYGTEFVAPNVPQSGSLNGVGSIDSDGSGNEIMDDMLPEESEMIDDSQPQDTGNGMPADGSDFGAMEPSDDWQTGGGNGNPSDNGGMDSSDMGISGGQPSDGSMENQTPEGSFENQPSDTGVDNQPQNTPGESLSQGNGEELYSGEVQNGNVVLQ